MAHPPDTVLLEQPLPPEVERHLASCPRCRVHRRLLGTTTDPADRAEPEAVSLEPGGTLLESDGTNHRWLVWDEQFERCVVVVEPLEPVDASELRRVTAVIEELAHPHLARVHRVMDGPPVRFIRDRIPGSHLGDLDLTSDPRAIAWLAQCASALAVLHEAGLAHGRLRASSIRVSPEGRVRITDVGLAHGTPEEDWAALAELFESVGPPISEVLNSPGTRGAGLLAWLLAFRDPGAGGGPRYQPRGLLGVGGMGEVNRVYDPVLERSVAQKVLSSSLLSSGEHIDRFLTEAHITAQLQHPGVVPVHDLEHLPDGAIAFTMKQIEGRTMGQVIQEVHAMSSGRWQATSNGWSLRRLVEALRRVCDAIAYAHDQGIVHLDLKPGNVMLGEYGEVLVFDWGLARRLGPQGTVELERASGTQGFMSPEQSRTIGPVVGPAADVYAIGATLRTILDGRSPEPGSPWVPARRDAPAELVSVVRKAMHPDAESRTATVQEIARDLAAWQDERPVASHSYTLLETIVRRLRPHQAPLAVSAVAVVVLLALASVAWVRVGGEREKADGMLAQSLVDRANLAWDARDPVRAEAYAAAAVGLAGRSDARGLLARLARGWRPRLVGSWNDGCEEIEVLGEARTIACSTGAEVRGLTPDGPTWSLPGAVGRLHQTPDGGWTALTHGSVVRADAAGASLPTRSTSEDTVDAVVLPDASLAVARDRRVEILDADGVIAGIDLEGPVRQLSHCGGMRFVAIQESGLALFDLATGDPPVMLGADRVTGDVRCAPDGRRLAVVSDRQVQIWSTDPAVQRHILVGHLGEVRTVDWSPDSSLLATGSADGTVRLWDTRTGEERGRLPGHVDVTDVAFGPDGASLITATRRSVRWWDLPAERTVGTFDAVVEVVSLRWAADGSLYTLDRLGRPEGFDPATGLETLPIFLRVVDLDTDPAGAYVAVVNRRGDFQVLDLEENVFVVDSKRVHAGGGTAVAWHPSAPLIASGGRSGDLRAWRMGEDGAEGAWAVGLGATIAALDWAADGTVLAARTEEAVVLLAGETGEELTRLPADVSAHAIGPHGKQLALAWTRGGLSLGRRNGTSAPPQFERLEVDGQVAGLSFASEQPLLASVTREGLVQVFHTEDGRELARLFAHPGGATDIGFSRDGATLASAGSEGEIVLFDTRPFLEPNTSLESEIALRYGVSRSGTELEFR